MRPPALQKEFFHSLADAAAIRTMFDHLPDVLFFVKDRQHRLIAASRNLLERLKLESESEYVGRTDYDFFSKSVADGFRADDKIVFRTGKPLLNRLEVWLDEQRRLGWFLTTKVPLRGKNGKVVGLMGLIRRDTSRGGYQPESEVTHVINYLEKHTDRILTTAELARECGLSERSLFRKINQALGVTPYELMLRIRIQKAAEALIKTNDKILQIATTHGFCSASTFAQRFRKLMGETPKQFRKRNQA